ncbi:MAG: hypothetical protein KJ067_20075 [Vicinamibacteria bacterium]|nr:hypothetical protein [Vicinamibacteria bacterium]MCL4821439.1 hypothetical protein [Vicinamibacteria bacterium]
MAQHDKTGDLVAQIEADEAARAAKAAPSWKGPSLLGRPAVMVTALLIFAASAVWSYARMQAPFPPPPLSQEQRVEAARYLLVNARAVVDEYRDRTGGYPDDLGAVIEDARRSSLVYRKRDDGYTVAMRVDEQLLWLDSRDDPAAFLADGSHVPMQGAATAETTPVAPPPGQP